MKGIKDNKTGRFVKNILERNCISCGELFVPRHDKQKCCSIKCRGIATGIRCNQKVEFTCPRCFKVIMISPSDKRLFCGMKCRSLDMIGKNVGAKNNFWKGGITPINLCLRTSSKYKNWVKDVFKRDNYTCQCCGDTKKDLNAHHIISFATILEKIKIEFGIENLYENAINNDLLWDINNGQTLCIDCHKKTDTYLKRLK